MIDRGKAVAKVLPSKTRAEVFIFGAVYVNAAQLWEPGNDAADENRPDSGSRIR
jgi:hypothetical protein